ncbi:hypothetical protein PG995_009331 [Apiospora arundinis]
MSAPIVYEGAAPGQRGTLFKDKKFWVAHRMPARQTWRDHIKNNGGQTVALEKDADYLIVDHVWKNPPPGSYSWRWIEDSVKKGELLDPEDYLVGAKPEDQPRAGPSAPAKGTRTPFTGEDDRILMEWVLKREGQGESILGNKIYQELAKKNPRHTFQSWRDRWVKKIQFQPRPNASHDNPGSQHAEDPEPMTNRQDTAATSLSRPPPPTPAKIEKKSKVKFTAEEDRQLTEYVLERTAETGFDRGNKVFMEYADEHPQHPWNSYRDRWVRHLRPADEEEKEEVVPRVRSSTRKKNATQSSRSEPPDAAQQTTSETPKSVTRQPDVAMDEPESSRGDSRNVKRHRDPSNSLSPDHMKHPPWNENNGETQEEVDHQLNDDNAQEYSQFARPSASGGNDQLLPSEAEDDVEPFPQTREQFHHDYQAFLKATDIQPNFWPTVRGQSFHLWDLWQHTVSQKVAPPERDWQQIAENLGYDWVRHDNVEHDLREIYEKNLAVFEESLVEFELNESGDSEGDEDMLDEAADVDSVSEAVGRNSEAHFNSSPPKQPSLKRTHEDALLSDQLYRESSGKRQRIHRDSEIPSTPDTKNGTKHLRRPVSAAVSPSDRRKSTLPKSSRAQQGTQKDQDFSAHGDQMITGSAKVQSKGRVIEPETQDFRYDPETQNLDFDMEMDDIQEESQATMTPSQQLHHESSPVKSSRRTLGGPSTPTPKRKAIISPFLESPDDGHEQPTPKARFGKGKNPILSDLEKQHHQLGRPSAGSTGDQSSIPPQPKPQRQSASRPAPSRPPPPSFPSSSAAPSKPSQLPPPSSLRKPQGSKPSVPAAPAATSKPPPSSAKDPVATGIAKLNKIIDHWVALGYAPPVAQRALEVTSWQRDLVVEIIQPLKEGKPLPTNIEGVWTAKDDMKLQFLMQHQQDATSEKQDVPDDKQAKRIEKKCADFQKHLSNKHGAGHIKLRHDWYEKKKRLGWEEIK